MRAVANRRLRVSRSRDTCRTEPDLPGSILVGDKESDIAAGIRAGVGLNVRVRSGHPLTDESAQVTSTLGGEIIGMAVPQPVLPGYALFHLAWHE